MPEKPVKSTKNKLFNFVTNIIYIHKKENGICVVKACKINGFKSFLNQTFPCWSQIILLQT